MAFIKLINVAANAMFSYDHEFFKQIDGVIMGSPLGSTLADFFLINLEDKVLTLSRLFLPKIYLRFVDAIFAVFDGSLLMPKFFNMLNKNILTLTLT